MSISPLYISHKIFYTHTKEDVSIFGGCKEILMKHKSNLYPYEIDGLIFTHCDYGVGSNKVGVAGPKENITWSHSFKWKPPEYNSIDFMVSVKKKDGEMNIQKIVEDGTNMVSINDNIEYVEVILRTGFNENVDGYINPCLNIIEDKLTIDLLPAGRAEEQQPARRPHPHVRENLGPGQRQLHHLPDHGHLLPQPSPLRAGQSKSALLVPASTRTPGYSHSSVGGT